jgi:outer membrane immunogenic protein
MNFRIFGAGAIMMVAVASVPAFAADPAKASSSAAIFDWSGFYLGAHGGYAWSGNRIDSSHLLFPADFSSGGGFGGVQFGYNSQFAPHWLIGSEIDFSFGRATGDATQSIPGRFGLNVDNAQNKIGPFGTVRARFGYVQDRALFYVTGGAMWIYNKYRDGTFLIAGAQVLGPIFSNVITSYDVGWVWGGGVEYAVDPHWSFKLEYLHTSFGQSRNTSISQFYVSDPKLSVLRVGVNYRFGGADVPAFAPQKSAPAVADWNGGYIGLHGGYGWARFDQPIVLGFGGSNETRIDATGGFGGLQGGYNWLFAPHGLFGLELDSSWGNVGGSGRTWPPIIQPAVLVTHVKLDDLGTARLRLGYVAGDTLLYVAGGAAYAREKASDSAGGVAKMGHFGWTAGAGIERMFAAGWSWKAEYSYADLGRYRYETFGGAGDLRERKNSSVTLGAVKIGINYHGPVLERLFGGK